MANDSQARRAQLTFISNLERLMQESGCTTQSHLSRLSGVTQPHISVLMKGRKEVTLATLARLSHALGYDPVQMLMPEEWLSARVPELLELFLRLPPQKRALVVSLAQDLDQ